MCLKGTRGSFVGTHSFLPESPSACFEDLRNLSPRSPQRVPDYLQKIIEWFSKVTHQILNLAATAFGGCIRQSSEQ